MILNNHEIVVPPGCPAIARNWQRIDLNATTMQFGSHASGPKDDAGNLAVSETYIGFYVDLDDTNNNYVEPRSLMSPSDSTIAEKALTLNERIQDGDEQLLTRLQDTFCERVAICRGVVNGECWALGPTAMTEVILEIPD